ncbi:MAG TPA: site-2 protease family protein [archaeon]|nr:site-2 protease family protein [archaeon]
MRDLILAEIDFFTGLLGFLVLCAIITFILKKTTKFDTFFLITLIRTKKPLAFFDRMAKHTKILDAFALLGLIIGFGAISVDFFWGRKLKLRERIILFFGSFSVLSGAFLAVDIFFGNVFSANLLIGNMFPLLVISFGLMGLAGFTLFSLFMQAFDIVGKYLIGTRSCPGVAPLIPGVEIPGVPITPPLHAWISLLIILLVHEGMHGIVGRRHGFTIKNAGVILFGFLPIGAFVEPDEKEIAKEKDEKVLPFLAAGPMSNLVVMVFAGIILFGALSFSGPLTEHFYPGLQDNFFSGVKVVKVLEETEFCGTVYAAPAFAKLNEGDLIKGISGVAVNSPQALFVELQKDRLKEKTFSLERNSEQISITLQPNEIGQFGFVPEGIRNESIQIPESYPTYALAIGLFIEFVFWLFLLNFLVAAINFLPMHPFDGGRMAKLLFVPYLGFLNISKEQKQEKITKFFLYIILALFVINALPLFF